MAKNAESAVAPVEEPVADVIEETPVVAPVEIIAPVFATDGLLVKANISDVTTDAGESVEVQEVVDGERIVVKPEETVILKGVETEKEIVESRLLNGYLNVFELVSATTESIILKNITDTPKQIVEGDLLLVAIIKV